MKSVSISTRVIALSQVILWVYSRVVVRFKRGLLTKDELLNTRTPLLAVSNHISLMDASLFIGSLSWREFRSLPPVRVIMFKWYYYTPLLPFTYLLGCYPTKPLFPFLKKYAGVEAGVRYLNQGYMLGIYPEGKRTPKGRIPAKNGISRIISQLDQNPDAIMCYLQKDGRKTNVVMRYVSSIDRQTSADSIMDMIYELK